jgi:hypothetical protein
MPTPSPNQNTPNPIGEFLNPKSMLTPGLAGAMTMAITNALCSNFALPRPIIALTLSVLLALLTVGAATMPIWQKGLFTIFNSLFIFAMAVGTSTLGAASAAPPQASLPAPASSVASTAYLHEWGGQIPDGTIVKATAPARYLMEAGMRRLIPDEETFKSLGPKNAKVKVIPDAELESIPLGKPLPSKRFFSSWF